MRMLRGAPKSIIGFSGGVVCGLRFRWASFHVSCEYILWNLVIGVQQALVCPTNLGTSAPANLNSGRQKWLKNPRWRRGAETSGLRVAAEWPA